MAWTKISTSIWVVGTKVFEVSPAVSQDRQLQEVRLELEELGPHPSSLMSIIAGAC